MSFILNPFERGINPETPEGSKLFMKATEGPKDEELAQVLQKNCKVVMHLMDGLAFQFGCSSLVNLVTV